MKIFLTKGNHKVKNTPEIEELKLYVEREYGRVLNTTTDFEELSLYLKRKTGEHVSASTLKRMWGYVGDSHKPGLRRRQDIIRRFSMQGSCPVLI